MARNCKLRCAAQTQYDMEEREFTHWGEYPTFKSELVTSTDLFRRKGLAGRHFKKPAFSISEREKYGYSRLVAAALIALALGGGV